MTSYISSLTPLRAAVVASTLSSYVFFIGNVSASYLGILPAIQSPDQSLDPAQKANLWRFFYDRAKIVFVSCIVVSTTAFGTAAYLSRSNRRIYPAIVGALATASLLPYTKMTLMPINAQLEAICEGDKVREPYTDKLVEKWRVRHGYRLVAGGVAFLCAFVLRESI